MAEEKIVKINIRRHLLKVPKWERKMKLGRILRKELNKDLVIDQKLNEKLWSHKGSKIRLKLVKDDKSVKASLVE